VLLTSVCVAADLQFFVYFVFNFFSVGNILNILLTGGAGYIGSHIAVALSEAGHSAVICDNFFNSSRSIFNQLKKITNKNIPVIECDVRNTSLLINVLSDFKIDGVIHLAGLKAVGESTKNPIDYYSNNVQGALSLVEAMHSTSVKNLVFSSSATVYGEPKYLPIDEDHPTGAKNPYGRSKLYIEEMLKDVANSDPEWGIVCLRYFNPVGAHESGMIGEAPVGIPNNLMPYISKVASGKLPILNIYGDDYPTHDGTGVRDYIHVMDLAEGHLAALNYSSSLSGWDAINLGTGKGISVLEILNEYADISGQKIPYSIEKRRTGDVAACFAKVDKAKKVLKWQARNTVKEMCASAWIWEQNIDQAS
jgi:UDP-glucose 4-epimerase